jgi:DTW domain-containing protein YfiP
VANRVVCERCRRPPAVCYCAYLPELATRTRVLLLQHPRERHVAVGTARMAHLALPNSVLRLGLDFAVDPVVRAVLDEPRPAYLLFPGPAARDASELPRDQAITLVVLDGTWSQARKLLKLNPFLETLPQVAFTPGHESEYRIRRQPAAFCVSTIEALAEVLPLLEPAGASLERLMDPFRAMVARQEHFATEIASSRHRRREGPRAAPPSAAASDIGAELARSWDRLICVYGEANAWPKRAHDRPEPEIVHWLAFRPATGETYEAVVAPRQALASATANRIGLSAETLHDGTSVESWQQSWTAFLRPDDVVVTWGPFHMFLAMNAGLTLPERMVDLRPQAPRFAKHRIRSVEEAVAALLGDEPAPPSVVPSGALLGRGGRRLRALAAVLDVLAGARVPAAEAAETLP